MKPSLPPIVGPIEDRGFTPKQLADRWQCCPLTVRRRIRGGSLRAQKNGRLVRVPLSEVLRFENEVTA